MQIDGARIGWRPPVGPTPVAGGGATGFAQTLTDALKEVNKLQVQSSGQAQQVVEGRSNGPGMETMMSDLEEASLAFQATLQFRNKAIEAYQDVMRMQF